MNYPINFEEIIKYQPIITIGVIGSVSNGKSTLVASLTGTRTQKHSDEQIRNITIRLGYANAKIYKCDTCSPPECYQSTSSNIMEHKCKICNNITKLITHVSFADVPGHTEFMSTMLNGSCVMDYTILVESGSNTEIPSPQSIEHYKIIKEIGIENKLVCLNKVDLLTRDTSQNMMNKLKDFFKETPVIPISGTLNCNIDVICHYLSQLQMPQKQINNIDFKMLIIRSFNINHGGTLINEMLGGVIGGTLSRGIIKVNQKVVLYPGFIDKRIIEDKKDTCWSYTPLKCKVLSIKSEKNNLEYAIQGGLIAIQLDIDPALSYDDKLVGQVLFPQNQDIKFKIFEGLIIEYKKKFIELELNKGDNIQVNINSNNINGQVIKVSKKTGELFLKLSKPVCIEINDFVTINIFDSDNKIKLYGYGIIIDGLESIIIN